MTPHGSRDPCACCEARHPRGHQVHEGALGSVQAREYARLIEEALVTIAAQPDRGKSRDDIRPGILAHHISQRGRSARHILFYRVNAKGSVEIIRLLHDAMDFARHFSSH
jgi:toxin ParE1/3/4